MRKFIELKAERGTLEHIMLITKERAYTIQMYILQRFKENSNPGIPDMLDFFNDRDLWDIKEFLYASYVIGMTKVIFDDSIDDRIDSINLGNDMASYLSNLNNK